jgi:plastocyanin
MSAGAGLLLPVMASAANHVVEARSTLTFSPSTLTIVAGDTVTFRNAGGFHNVVSDPGAVTSFRCANGCDATGGNGNLSSSAWSATVTFPSPGTIGYYCEAHGASGGIGMSGKVTVNPAPVTHPVRHDFNGDGRADILWRNSSTGSNAIWRSGSSGTPQAVTSVTNLAWTVAGSGDYNGDGRADILWRNTSTGGNIIWRSASSASQQAVSSLPTAWRVVGSGDYNGDGRADILWRNSSTGSNAIWRSGSSGTPQAVTSVTNLAWTVAGSGD